MKLLHPSLFNNSIPPRMIGVCVCGPIKTQNDCKHYFEVFVGGLTLGQCCVPQLSVFMQS